MDDDVVCLLCCFFALRFSLLLLLLSSSFSWLCLPVPVYVVSFSRFSFCVLHAPVAALNIFCGCSFLPPPPPSLLRYRCSKASPNNETSALSRHTDGQRDRQRDRLAGRQAGKQSSSQVAALVVIVFLFTLLDCVSVCVSSRASMCVCGFCLSAVCRALFGFCNIVASKQGLF